jgi:hypothetical protein
MKGENLSLSTKFKRYLELLLLVFFTQVLISQNAAATAIFSGSFIKLSVESSKKDISINYPKPGKNNICGIEIKSNVIVLNPDVWEKFSSMIEVREFHDDQFFSLTKPMITVGYSPTLRYFFSSENFSFGTFSIRSTNGRSLQEISNLALSDGQKNVDVIAVASSCEP